MFPILKKFFEICEEKKSLIPSLRQLVVAVSFVCVVGTCCLVVHRVPPPTPETSIAVISTKVGRLLSEEDQGIFFCVEKNRRAPRLFRRRVSARTKQVPVAQFGPLPIIMEPAEIIDKDLYMTKHAENRFFLALKVEQNLSGGEKSLKGMRDHIPPEMEPRFNNLVNNTSTLPHLRPLMKSVEQEIDLADQIDNHLNNTTTFDGPKVLNLKNELRRQTIVTEQLYTARRQKALDITRFHQELGDFIEDLYLCYYE